MEIPEQYKPWPGFVFELKYKQRAEKGYTTLSKEYEVVYPSTHCVLCKNTKNGIHTSFRYDELIKAGVIDHKAGYPGYCIDKAQDLKY